MMVSDYQESKLKCFVIAVDGVNSAGKGTISRLIAQKYGFAHLDTGKIYRFLGYNLAKKGIDLSDEVEIAKYAQTLDYSDLTAPELLGNDIGQIASKIAVFSMVRESLNTIQRAFPAGKKGVVVDGRDIGTVIFPDADIKFFITADIEERARRRQLQLAEELNQEIAYEKILAEVKSRDERDVNRKISPCVAAKDAIIIDTTNTTPEQLLDQISLEIDKKLVR